MTLTVNNETCWERNSPINCYPPHKFKNVIQRSIQALLNLSYKRETRGRHLESSRHSIAANLTQKIKNTEEEGLRRRWTHERKERRRRCKKEQNNVTNLTINLRCVCVCAWHADGQAECNRGFQIPRTSQSTTWDCGFTDYIRYHQSFVMQHAHVL
jgi:hypothetical protein